MTKRHNHRPFQISRKERKARSLLVSQWRRYFTPGTYVIDCRDHPCVITKAEVLGFSDSDVEVKSLINGTGGACSLRHCGIERIPAERALAMAEFARTHTWTEYLQQHLGFTDSDIAGWTELDRVWDFDKGEMVPKKTPD